MNQLLLDVCDMLETYRGRDKIIRLLCYLTKFMSAVSINDEVAKKLATFSSQMSATRATLRLFDDLPALRSTLEYGSGKSEPDQFIASIGVTSNIIDNVFYPIEKICWLAEHKIIEGPSQPWDVLTSACWVATTYLTFMKSLRLFTILRKQKQQFKIEDDRDSLNRIQMMERIEMISFIRCIFDLLHSVHGLPAGFLWSSKLKLWQVGLIGTVSSVLGIYQMFARKSLSKVSK